MFSSAILWIFIAVNSTFAAPAADSAINIQQGFILTGPKRLLIGSSERFCVSSVTVKDVEHSLANCTLDLIINEVPIATTNHRLNGIHLLKPILTALVYIYITE